VRDLEVVYQRGGEPAARDVAFTLAPGEGLLIAGDHGAGKTSVLRAVLGLAVASGDIAVFGSAPGTPAAAARTGYAPQGRFFMEGHSPAELVAVVAALRRGRRAPEEAAAALRRAGVAEPSRRARIADAEEARRVAFACAIAGDPDLIVLDDPWEFPETMTEIERARARGAAVLVATDEPAGFAALLGRSLVLVDGART
jgi:ABC-2 type transport system ATP-binding protein